MRHRPTPSVLLLLCVATAAATATVDAVRLRVVSFNIHAFRDAEHRDNLDALSELLNEVKPDVVCLNEVIHPWSSPPPDDPYWEEIRQRRGYGRVPPLGSVPLSPSSTHLYRLAQAIGMRHVVFGCASPERSFFGRVPFGNAVLSRYELEDVVHGVMRADPDVDLHLGDQQRTLQDLEDRGVTTATVVLPGGRRLGVCVTHLDHKAEELREKQAQQASRTAGATMAVSKPMNAMPFLTAASCQSSGLPGAATGFDPLYLSDFMDIKWLREAELKHGRICMLATTGYFLQEFYSLPNYPGYSANPVEAFSSVPPEGLLQIIFFMGWLEVTANKGKYTMMNMFEDGRTPGDLGFDPLKFGENKATRERLEMAELKNGRLAMIAFSGMLHQTFVTGKPLWASVQEIFATPSGGLA